MPIQVALFGTGIYASSDYVPSLLATTNDHIHVHTIWSLDRAAAELSASKFSDKGHQTQVAVGDQGIDEILAKPEIDAVILVLPFMFQAKLIKRAWAAGKHVLSEKPIERDVKAGMALVEEYERDWKPKGLLWRVAEDYDHEPIHYEAAARLRDSAMGPVLYWDLQNQNFCPDGDPYQSTSWRNVPTYQGGFLLDGGVHSAALLRVVLPHPPTTVVAAASLHRGHIPPHDTILALALSDPSATTNAHGPPSLQAASSTVQTFPPGQSFPSGVMTFSWALPNLESRPPGVLQILSVTCLNGKLTLVNDNQTRHLEVQPAIGSNVVAYKTSSVKKGVEVELAFFGRAVAAVKAGCKVDPKEEYGKPLNMVRDVALIEAMLKSNGEKKTLQSLFEEI